jgi:hypothetical protein
MGSAPTTSPAGTDLKLAQILADYYGLNAEQTNAYFDRVVAGELEFAAIADFTRWGKDGKIEACMPEPQEMTRLQVAERLITVLLPLAAQHVRRRYAVVGSSQYEMDEWERCETAIRGAQRFLGLKPEGVFLPEND